MSRPDRRLTAADYRRALPEFTATLIVNGLAEEAALAAVGVIGVLGLVRTAARRLRAGH